MDMKSKRYAVILGLVALSAWCLWRGQVSPTQSPVRDDARQASTSTPTTEKAPARIQSAKTEAETTDRFLERLAVDLTVMQAEADAIRRDENVQVFVDSIAFADIPATLQFLQRPEQTQMLQDMQVLLIRKGASNDPQAAAVWAEQMPAGTTRSASIAGVGVVWANQNLVEAARWASALAEGEDRENGLAHVAFEGARTQPIFALELTPKLAPNDARDELVRHAARQWAAQHPAGAVAWAGEITNPTLREQILSDIAAAWGETDPGSAAALAMQSLSGGKLEEALVGIAQHWVQKEPDRAATWVLGFPETLQQNALQTVIKLWAGKDAPRAEKWVGSLPPGVQRDTAVDALAAR
jgi:hypothetical protein